MRQVPARAWLQSNFLPSMVCNGTPPHGVGEQQGHQARGAELAWGWPSCRATLCLKTCRAHGVTVLPVAGFPIRRMWHLVWRKTGLFHWRRELCCKICGVIWGCARSPCNPDLGLFHVSLPQAIASAATILCQRRRTGTQGPVLPDACRPQTLSDAWSVQQRRGRPVCSDG